MGWYLAQNDTRDDFVTDPIGYADFASQLSERLKYVMEQIQNHRYRPQHLIEIDVPKSGLSVRPGSVLPIQEMIVLHACTLLLAPKLDKKLSASVYSYRLRKDWKAKIKKRKSLFRETEPEFPFLKKETIADFNPFEAWYECWPEFEADSIKAFSEGYTHLTKTDITAYFENIDLSILEDILRKYLKDEDHIIQLIFRILRSWTRLTSTGTPIGRGIPQGNEISSFLGNIYLLPLDRELDKLHERYDAVWFRYVDDVKVFTKSEHHARQVVFAINNALRSLHLNLQGAKTKILTGKELEKDLSDDNQRLVSGVFEDLCKNNYTSKEVTKRLSKLKSLVSPFCRKEKMSSIIHLRQDENRLLRRLMSIYGMCGRTRLKKTAYEAIRQLPDIRLLKKSLAYLSQLPYKYHDEILEFLLDIIEKEDLPIPYQTGLVLETISKLHPVKVDGVATRIRRMTLTRKTDWIVVQKALEAISMYPYRADWCKMISETYLGHDHHLVRRASCLLLLRCPIDYAERRLRQLIYHPDVSISRMALYFLRLAMDSEYAQTETQSLAKGNHSVFSFQKNLHRFYAMTMCNYRNILALLRECLDKYEKIEKSKKLLWHRDNIRSHIDLKLQTDNQEER